MEAGMGPAFVCMQWCESMGVLVSVKKVNTTNEPSARAEMVTLTRQTHQLLSLHGLECEVL